MIVCAAVNTENATTQLDCLRQHGVFPPVLDPAALAPSFAWGEDLTPFLFDAWTTSLRYAQTSQQRRLAKRILDWLERQISAGAVLSWGMPSGRGTRVQQWVGDRLIWWPAGVPQGRWIGIVSSRLNRLLEHQRPWFAALRSTCEEMERGTVILTSTRTTTCPFLERCHELFQIPLLRLELSRVNQSVAQWFPPKLNDSLQKQFSSKQVRLALVSPPLDCDPFDEPPLRDRLVMAAGDQVFVLGMRAGGYIEQLVRRRCAPDETVSKAEVSLAVGPGLIAPSLARSIPDAEWLELDPPPTRRRFPVPVGRSDQGAAILPLHQWPLTDYLTHCTRAVAGPWPDQTAETYRDALILDHEEADHSALATLARITTQATLLASSQGIRGATPVVCFTAVAIQQLKHLHAFRAHQGRWDFEPYGICISRHWLEQRGTRSVAYGEPSLWDQLTAADRPFFQRRRGGRKEQIDWSVEREWRHVGDVDLGHLPREAAVLFVPTLEEARWLSQCSRWPVTVLDYTGRG